MILDVAVHGLLGDLHGPPIAEGGPDWAEVCLKLRPRLHRAEPVVGFKGIEQLTDRHTVLFGTDESLEPELVSADLLQPLLQELLSHLPIWRAAALADFLPPMAIADPPMSAIPPLEYSPHPSHRRPPFSPLTGVFRYILRASASTS